MKVEFSNDCELAAYLFVLAGFNVRVNNTRDLHIKSVEDDGMRLCDYDDDLLDYSDVPSTLWSWDEIDEIFVY